MKYDQLTEAKNREEKLEVVKLPYKLGELSPVLSKNNVDYHYNVLTKAYVRRYNEKEEHIYKYDENFFKIKDFTSIKGYFQNLKYFKKFKRERLN
mgnify:CR=1 FL=1